MPLVAQVQEDPQVQEEPQAQGEAEGAEEEVVVVLWRANANANSMQG